RGGPAHQRREAVVLRIRQPAGGVEDLGARSRPARPGGDHRHDHGCRQPMSRLRVSVAMAGLACVAAVVLATVSPRAQVGDRAAIDAGPPPAHWHIPPAPVRTPEESMRMMDLADGFTIDLIAAEPLVQDPIAIAFDARHRLW